MAKGEKSDYAKKLLDPRWQKKRLEVLERDGWACRRCDDRTSTLHVHHCYYEGKREPWDYPPASLVTLCATCHEAEAEVASDTRFGLWRDFAKHGLLAEQINWFLEALEYPVAGEWNSPSEVIRILTLTLSNRELWEPAAEAAEEFTRETGEFGGSVSADFDAKEGEGPA